MITATAHGANLTIEQLATTCPTPPTAGGRWAGIPHRTLADAIVAECTGREWRVTGAHFAVNKKGTELAGAFTIEAPIQTPEGIGLALGVTHSNDRRKALKIYAGGNVAVCSNGMAVGECVLRGTHDRGFILRDALAEAMDEYLVAAYRIAKEKDTLEAIAITPTRAEHLMMAVGRAGLLPWSRVGAMDEEYRANRFGHGTGTGWALYNAFTYVVKTCPPMEQMDRMNNFREIIKCYA